MGNGRFQVRILIRTRYYNVICKVCSVCTQSLTSVKHVKTYEFINAKKLDLKF